ncbi:hypothetical protein PspLS_06870 [Pyricularia sp. CBS 133598]|nr:hypothetical protein PspLS_06870 [Pyricularia sp. CBS 133598]
MGKPTDENLPEVVPGDYPQTVPDSSPQALTAAEAEAHRARQLAGGDAHMYHDGVEVVDSPKYVEVPVGLEAAHHNPYSPSAPSSVPWEPVSAIDRLQAGGVDSHGSQADSDEGVKPKPRTIWGLPPTHFYLLLTVLLLLAVAIGAGVGAGVTAANNRAGQRETQGDAGGASSNNGESGGSKPTTTGPKPITPTGTPYDPPLNESDPDGPFAFQGWSGPNFTGNMTIKYRKYGIFDLEFPVVSYVWDPNGYTCCVTFCANNTDTSGKYRCLYRKQEEASSHFGRIHTYCGGNNSTKAMSCS